MIDSPSSTTLLHNIGKITYIVTILYNNIIAQYKENYKYCNSIADHYLLLFIGSKPITAREQCIPKGQYYIVLTAFTAILEFLFITKGLGVYNGTNIVYHPMEYAKYCIDWKTVLTSGCDRIFTSLKMNTNRGDRWTFFLSRR